MTNSDVNFTIITPVFNGENFIEETVNSVLKYAPGSDFEYLVINDGSTDSTGSILERYGDSITLINQQNMGEAASVNLGFSLASGKYCLVVSADDPLISSKLFEFSKLILDLNESVVVTYPDWRLIDHHGHKVRDVLTKDFSLYELVGMNTCIPGPGAIFRTLIAKKIGGRDARLRYGSDYEFWLRMSQAGTFQRIPEVLAQWRGHPGSTSIKSRSLEMAQERISIIENFLSVVKLPHSLENIARANSYYSAAILRYFDPSIPHRKYLLKAFRHRKGWVETAKIHELLYLVTIPVSELLWNLIKNLSGKSKL